MGLLALGLYTYTLAPDVHVSDFAEFQYLPAKLGLPHPNGFPAYVLLGWLWSHLPLGSLAWRMNLLAAIGGALAVTVTTGFAYRLSGRAAVAIAAALLLTITPTLWKFSVAAERYGLALALVVGSLWAAVWVFDHKSQGIDQRRLLLSSFLLSLALATHPSMVTLIPFWLGYLLWTIPDLRRSLRPWLRMALAGLPPLLLYLYVPWRWSALATWPLLPGLERSAAIYAGMGPAGYAPGNLEHLWDYLTFGASMVRAGSAGFVERLLGITVYWWPMEIPLWMVGLAAIGFWRIAKKDGVLAGLLIGWALAQLLLVGSTDAAKFDAYLLPTFWTLLFCAAFAVDAAAAWRHKAQWLALAALLPLLVILLVQRWPRHDLSRSLEVRQDWETILAHPLEEGAALLADWSDLTPFWYLQQAEERRPDLVGLFPPQAEQVIQPWLKTGRPLYLAAPLHGYAASFPPELNLIPWGHLVRVIAPGEPANCPPRANPAITPESWPLTLANWDWDRSTASGGDTLHLRLCWQAHTVLPSHTFLTLVLTSADGKRSTSTNHPLIVSWFPGEGVAAYQASLGILPVRLPPGMIPGEYSTRVRPFWLDAEGRWQEWPGVDALSTGTITVLPDTHFRRQMSANEVAPLLPLHAGPLALRAWRLSDQKVRPGDPLEVEMLWQVQRPLEQDLYGQIRFWGGDGRGLLTSPEPLFQTAFDPSWPPGILLRSRHVVRAPRGEGDQHYWLELRLWDGEEQQNWFPTGWLILGSAQVVDRSHRYAPPEDAVAQAIQLGNLATLAGHSLLPGSLCGHALLDLSLYWRVIGETDTRYQVFVHLVDEEGRMLAQHDSIPGSGELPTDLWILDEVIADPHWLVIPDDRAAAFWLRIGLYDPATGERLPVIENGAQEGDFVLLGPMPGCQEGY
jgi:hypothetical protein